jgi:hypothetical protein
MLQVAFLDYVRYLVGSMWGSCTPATFTARRGDINQGMHKRDAAHQLAMVIRAAQLLSGRLSRIVPFDAEQMAQWNALPLALRSAAAGVHAAEEAGAIVRSYFGVTLSTYSLLCCMTGTSLLLDCHTLLCVQVGAACILWRHARNVQFTVQLLDWHTFAP